MRTVKSKYERKPKPGFTTEEMMALDPMGAIYTFTDDDGGVTHIASTVLRMVAERILKPTICYFGDELLEAVARGYTGVEEAHALKLPDEALEIPVLVCEWGGKHVIADGAHRMWRRIQRGDTSFPAYVIPEKAWRNFVVTDVPGNAAQWREFNTTVKTRDGPDTWKHPKNPFKGKG